MNIKTFIESYGRRELAADAGVSTSLVSHWATGRRAVGVKNIQRLIELSGGKLKPEDLRPDIFRGVSA